ncbi:MULTISPECIES: S8 family peptidase [unclassified Romboutsia]|uniref:S8 family peptidase n=1 Tax=unclassified Romboutsia TaxID=2626894 RepID=UPI0008216C24|nr:MULTISPECIES: S8 family peptidase [unclassified Romboutsia]SCH38698.1 Intracellular serine protease [uncultured Clostridium sp.]
MKNKDNNGDFTVKLIPYIKNDEIRSSSSFLNYGINMIQAKNFWQQSSMGEGVNIAIIDSGCDIYHEDLKECIVGVRNFTDEDNKNPNIVTDRVGHGTHVTGIIAAQGKHNIVGVAPKSNIYILKSINRSGSGKLSWVINAIYYAIEKKVDIISMSLGMSENSEKLQRAVKEASSKNILVVCAAGNEGDGNSEEFQYSYPASYVEVVSVGAVDKKGNPAYFSNANLVIDLVAPGVEIVSTYPNNTYASLSGTSMAAPYVSGSLALLKNWSRQEFQRDLTEQELYAQLIKHTRTLDYSRTVQGNGLIYLKEEKITKKIKY